MNDALKKWDRITEIRVIDHLEDDYGHRLEGEHFELAGHDGPDEARLALAIDRDDGSYSHRIEVRASLDGNGYASLAEGRDLALDVLGWVLEKYFGDGRRWRIPLDWTEVRFAGKTAYLRGERRNLEAERLAEELLGEK